MIRELNKDEFNKIKNLGKMLKDNFDESKISSHEKVFVYEEDDIIGFIQISNLYETLEIINIVVDPSKRQSGFGTMLINHVIKIFKPDHILLEVRKSNHTAINFYKRAGFVEIRKIKNYYGNEDGIVMERKFL